MDVYTTSTGLHRVGPKPSSSALALGLSTVFLLLCTPSVISTSDYIKEVFTDSTSFGDFNHMVVDKNTGMVYVGAVNHLYRLSGTLGLLKSLNTGPVDDSPNCQPEMSCGFTKVLTDSVNKALLIDYKSSRLIACFNVYQGYCEKRLLSLDDKDEIMWESVVPSDETSSVVMFIAPGYPNTASTSTLYVGATRSTKGESAFKDMIPAVCSRNLVEFKLVFNDRIDASKMEIESQQRGTFRVDYVYGFGSGDFSYFLMVQKESVGSNDYASRIARVCQGDHRFFSYTEIPLQCTHNGTNFNILRAATVTHAGAELARSLVLSDLPPLTDREHVMFAIFSRSNRGEKEPLADSALCVYSLKDIRRQFTETISECFRGIGNVGPAHFVLRSSCFSVDYEISDSYCGDHDFNKPIAGSRPITQEAAAHFPGVSLTSVAISVTFNYSVALLGTKDGVLKKLVVESQESAFKYENVTVETGSPVNADLQVDRSGDYVYVMTQKRVTRVKLHNCEQYTRCDTCLAARDPYCGWCSLESKCSLRSECNEADKPLHWLPYKGAQCTRITKVYPDQVQIPSSTSQESRQLQLTVQYLPVLGSTSFRCAFSGHGVDRTTPVTYSSVDSASGNSSLTCETPNKNLLPPIPYGKDGTKIRHRHHDRRKHRRRRNQDHIVMKLSLRHGDVDLVSKNFTFFDCTLHTSCSDCTDSAYPCTWCVRSHKCTHDRETCGSDILVTGRNVQGPSDRVGPDACPKIENSSKEILVPSGKVFNVSVRAINLQDFQTDLKCVFSAEKRVEVQAILLNNVIRCTPTQFEYTGPTALRNVPFQITWGSDRRPLDNPRAIQVKVYKCSAMANSCGHCLVVEDKYDCGWCSNPADPSTSSCEIQDQCSSRMSFLDNSKHCPNPVITSFYPESGPREGGTNLTIRGENLGKLFEDIENGVYVADVRCEPYRSEYTAASRIVCRTGLSTSSKSGLIKVSVDNDHVGQSDKMFRYVSPRITSFEPNIGPFAGGTLVTIHGDHMNTGNEYSLSATVNNLSCPIVRKEPSYAVCRTQYLENTKQNSGPIVLKFDNATVKLQGHAFTYVDNPTIKDVNPKKGTFSGGARVTVTGTNLHAIRSPQMVVYYMDEEFTSNCSKPTPNQTTCESPNFQGADFFGSRTKRNTRPDSSLASLDFGFIMDNVTELRNYSATKGDGEAFVVYPDPVFHVFEDGVKRILSKNNELLISGEGLDLVYTDQDLIVTVGGAYCNNTQLSPKLLTCTPPSHLLKAGQSQPVMLQIGPNNTIYIGDLQVEDPVKPFSFTMIIGIGAGLGGLALLVVLLFIIAYRRKSQESDRVLKRMQNQMDVLESKVAKECKEAFAELQTEVTDLTSDLGGMSGIPFRDYRSFTMRVLFPSVPENDHPVTRNFDFTEHEVTEQGLRHFNQLLGNKIFLLSFIRTLEASKDFVARDKVNVASLLSTALQNRMEYQTDILKTLLAELIERAMEGRGTPPKILLRRTESVAEKMLTNWFTFLLYKFLKECAGQPLFLLYRAVKQQINKGPVDALTGEARYSLSEDKLIRQQVDYHMMTIHVKEDDFQYSHQQHAVKVLDCDTISQVKEKILDSIYKNAPFSCRPSKDDLDLEWITGCHGHLILQDEDKTSRQEGEFRRLNTLAHYKVPDGAFMALQNKQTSMYNMSSNSHQGMRYGDKNDMYHSSSPSLSRSLSPNALSINIDRAKSYHLVKDHESESHREGDRSSKMVSEIYLTRLLATKGTLQQFVDDLFETIFSTANRSSSLPLAVKYMFDFLDDQALHHGVTDPETVHTWKSNSLPLRFWVNIVKNPDFVFDMHKSNIVDSCLSVVAQIFMDSCCMSKHQLSKDSPSSKLLYAKDIPKYKKWVERYYQDIKLMPAISDQDMNTLLAEESRTHQNEFNLNAALYELYQYVRKYFDEIQGTLEENEFARQYRLVHRLDQVQLAMNPDSYA